MDLDYDLPAHWTQQEKEIFSRMYRHTSTNQKLFAHPKADEMPQSHWDTICWNLAWIAAGCVSECDGFIHINERGEVLATEVTKDMMQ